MTNKDAVKVDQFAHIPETYADHDLPVISADLILSLFNVGGLVKVSFGRLEPEIFGRPMDPLKPKVTPVLQLVLPLQCFAATAIFFQDQLKEFIAAGFLPADIEQTLRKPPPKRTEE